MSLPRTASESNDAIDIRVRGSRSLQIASFDRSHTSSCRLWPYLVCLLFPRQSYCGKSRFLISPSTPTTPWEKNGCEYFHAVFHNGAPDPCPIRWSKQILYKSSGTNSSSALETDRPTVRRKSDLNS